MLGFIVKNMGKPQLKIFEDTNPKNCKTKILIFLIIQRDYPSHRLCWIKLPWVNKVKFLRNPFSITIDGNHLHIRMKTAKFVEKNFAHPKGKSIVNNIHKGSELWKMKTKE